MSYRPQNVTYIDDLPDLDQLEGQGQYQGQYQGNQQHSSYNQAYGNTNSQQPDVSKYIRQHSHTSNNQVDNMHGQEFYSQSQQEPQEPQQKYQQQQQEIEQYNIKNSPTCIEISDHVSNCPICCKFYNNDNTIYIIVIIVLTIICLLLLKRVLDI
jgi:hypothetical protein